jgi:hypothetical protein
MFILGRQWVFRGDVQASIPTRVHNRGSAWGREAKSHNSSVISSAQELPTKADCWVVDTRARRFDGRLVSCFGLDRLPVGQAPGLLERRRRGVNNSPSKTAPLHCVGLHRSYIRGSAWGREAKSHNSSVISSAQELPTKADCWVVDTRARFD